MCSPGKKDLYLLRRWLNSSPSPFSTPEAATFLLANEMCWRVLTRGHLPPHTTPHSGFSLPKINHHNAFIHDGLAFGREKAFFCSCSPRALRTRCAGGFWFRVFVVPHARHQSCDTTPHRNFLLVSEERRIFLFVLNSSWLKQNFFSFFFLAPEAATPVLPPRLKAVSAPAPAPQTPAPNLARLEEPFCFPSFFVFRRVFFLNTGGSHFLAATTCYYRCRRHGAR